MDETEVMPVMLELARYLRRNPLASDTPQGIVRWWLQVPVARPALLDSALRDLVARGILESRRAADGRRRYRRCEPAELVDRRIDELLYRYGMRC